MNLLLFYNAHDFSYFYHDLNLKRLLSEEDRYSLIESNGFCSASNNKWMKRCLRKKLESIERCAAYCTHQALCIGYAYKDFGYSTSCYLFWSADSDDYTCPIGWQRDKRRRQTVKSMKDMKAYPGNGNWANGFVCYGKNSGKYI